jgi:hypothetical protein
MGEERSCADRDVCSYYGPMCDEYADMEPGLRCPDWRLQPDKDGG